MKQDIEHAFDYLQIKEKAVVAVDLLTKERLAMRLKKDASVRMALPALGGKVWKL